MGCFFAISLPPSADSAKINIISTNSKQDAARHLDATRGKHRFLCYIFRLRVFIKALLKQSSLYLLSHFCIRIIVLTYGLITSLLEIISRNHECLQNHTNHSDVRPILFQLKSSLPFSLFLFVWRLESTTTKYLWRHLNRGIHADVIVYIFAHLHTTLRTEENLLAVYWLQATKELVKLKPWLEF